VKNQGDVMARTDDITGSYELAREYGSTDSDGQRPDMIGHFRKEAVPSLH
jgi:hypothetical protein